MGFPRMGVCGGDSGVGEPPNGLPPGICGEKLLVLMVRKRRVYVTTKSHLPHLDQTNWIAYQYYITSVTLLTREVLLTTLPFA